MSGILKSEDLRYEQVPGEGCSWEEIQVFSTTLSQEEYLLFDVSILLSSKEEDGVLGISELRALLYYYYRKYNHIGVVPMENEREEVNEILNAIRRRLKDD